MRLKPFKEFIKLEAVGGITLFACAVLALIVTNSPLHHYYTYIFQAPFSIAVGKIGLTKPILSWVNEGLMTIFFLLIGLEIKRELIKGELSTLAQASLPCIAAIGGMIVPALIFVYANWGDPIALQGWAIPVATDIAFALGLLALLGSRVPVTLKIFLTALAIFDDLGAIIIIAIFYTEKISLLLLILAAICIAGLFTLNRLGVRRLGPYFLVGVLLWLCVLKSGVHATLAGVVLAFAIPSTPKKGEEVSPLHHLEDILNPWVAFLVLPLFAFANAGLSFKGMHWGHFLHPIPLGIALGLFLGKQLGVFGATWFAIKTGLSRMPTGANWLSLYGIAVLCGVGFTMSLFIGMLAYNGLSTFDPVVHFGVLTGSLVSGIVAYLLLRMGTK